MVAGAGEDLPGLGEFTSSILDLTWSTCHPCSTSEGVKLGKAGLFLTRGHLQCVTFPSCAPVLSLPHVQAAPVWPEAEASSGFCGGGELKGGRQCGLATTLPPLEPACPAELTAKGGSPQVPLVGRGVGTVKTPHSEKAAWDLEGSDAGRR